MSKRHLTLFGWLLLLALLAVACGGGEETDTANENDASTSTDSTDSGDSTADAGADCFMDVEEGASIIFSGWGDEAEQEIYRDSIARFNEVCPAVTVDYQPIPADFQTSLKASMAGGTAPDVFYVDDQLMTAFGPTGQLLPLDDFMADAGTSRDDFIPALLSIFTQNGVTYALPKDWGTLGLVYLPEAFADAGVDEPTADWTWDDLKAAAEAIQATGNYAGFCQNADWARFAPWAFGNGGAYANADLTAGTLNTPEVIEAAEFVTGMYADGSLVTAADVGAGWCGEAIGKELAAMTYEGGWMVNYMRNEFPEVTWTAQELPAGSAGKAGIIFTNGIGVNAATQYPNASAAFAIYVTGRDNQGAIVETGFAYSTHPDQLDDIVDENDAAIARAGTFDLTRVAYWGPNTGKVNDAVSQALERVYLGDQSVEEAFAQANEEATAVLTGEGADAAGGAIEVEESAGCFMEVEDGATIIFSGWGDEAEQTIYRDSIDRFAEVCPAVTVDYQPIPADFQTSLKASMAGGTAPDVFYVDDQLMTAFGPTGQLLALDDAMAAAGTGRGSFIPALLSIFTLDGSTYALPKDWGTLGLVYLPEAFAAAGIDEPTADWTWDDLKAAAEAIAATGEYAGFCQNADWARFAPWAFGNGGAYASDDYASAQANSDAVKEAATFVTDMYADGSLVTAADVGAGWCGEAIGKELAAMTYEGGWMVNYMRNEFPDVNWVAQELPTGPAGKAGIIFTNGIGVNAATQYPQASAAFTIYVTGVENQGEIVQTGFAYSTHPEQLDDVVDENDAAIARAGTFELTRVAYWGPNTGKVNDAIAQALERVYLGDQTVDEAFEQANEEIQGFLDEVQ
ncbi:ABC transporter substrate-binding protein [Candidatus Leptofilum sp.]|uniref:ABC transporter substrate-binding protein n=1 Tax=Candidatus Leptofilum sp. TaxID=3241576 RepID=UPI003B5A3E1D